MYRAGSLDRVIGSKWENNAKRIDSWQSSRTSSHGDQRQRQRGKSDIDATGTKHNYDENSSNRTRGYLGTNSPRHEIDTRAGLIKKEKLTRLCSDALSPHRGRQTDMAEGGGTERAGGRARR